MKFIHKKGGRALPMPAGIGIGLGVATLITLFGCALTAYLVLSGRVEESWIGYGAMVILVAASFLAAFVAQLCVKHRRVVVCTIASVSYYLMLILVTAFCFGGQYQGMGTVALMVLLGMAAACAVSLYEKKPGKHRGKIGVYR